MDTQRSAASATLKDRAVAVRETILRRLKIVSPEAGNATAGGLEASLMRPFRAWWDFNTPWRNKK